jgi:hypothetical protein
MGSPVAVLENKNLRKTAEIPGWFSLGDFCSISKKLSAPLGEDAL